MIEKLKAFDDMIGRQIQAETALQNLPINAESTIRSRTRKGILINMRESFRLIFEEELNPPASPVASESTGENGAGGVVLCPEGRAGDLDANDNPS